MWKRQYSEVSKPSSKQNFSSTRNLLNGKEMFVQFIKIWSKVINNNNKIAYKHDLKITYTYNHLHKKLRTIKY